MISSEVTISDDSPLKPTKKIIFHNSLYYYNQLIGKTFLNRDINMKLGIEVVLEARAAGGCK
jgi:hypothetical protein